MDEKLLVAKIALCLMIQQFMYERVDDNGIEYFDDYCESAGEHAFSVLGFKDDIIPKTEFYKLYDELENELFMLRNGKPYPYSHLDNYKKDFERRKEKVLEEKRQKELCSGCMYDDCLVCSRSIKTHCCCPCDSCKEENGKMTNYYSA